jgi:DNA invertase Pin-like site-specific DNA recombinase
MMIPAYALFRRSTAQQDLSIEEQRAAVRAWAAEHGYHIIREFADDASGLDTDRRREFLTLLSVCSQPNVREATVVLCYDVSRFSRLDPEEAGFHEYSLRRAGVNVIYTHEPGANEAGITGQLIKSLKRVLAHDFSQKLSQVVRRGLRAHAALGHWVGGRPPYGYRRAICQKDGTIRLLEAGHWRAKGENVVLVIEPSEASVVRDRIFTAYAAERLGVHAIADRLNRQGVPAPASHTRHGVATWSKGTVWTMLRNPIYRGELVYGKARYREVGRKRGKLRRPETEHVIVQKAVPAIVPDTLWNAAQARHGTRRFASGRPWHRPYLLSGLIECAHCGKRFQAPMPFTLAGTTPRAR